MASCSRKSFPTKKATEHLRWRLRESSRVCLYDVSPMPHRARTRTSATITVEHHDQIPLMHICSSHVLQTTTLIAKSLLSREGLSRRGPAALWRLTRNPPIMAAPQRRRRTAAEVIHVPGGLLIIFGLIDVGCSPIHVGCSPVRVVCTAPPGAAASCLLAMPNGGTR